MSRGTQRRRGAKSSGRGAAKGSGSIPPGVASSGSKAAPPSEAKRGRGRPKRAELGAPAVEDLEKKLATLKGVQGLEVTVVHRLLRGGMNRDDVAGHLGILRVTARRRAELAEDEQDRKDAARAANVAEVKRHLAGRRGSALRADVAPAPPARRGRETLQ